MTRTTADTDVFRAIADPTRRAFLEALVDGPRSFGDLHQLVSMSKGAVSQHLSILTSVGLVAVDDEDRSRRYRLVPAPLAEVDGWLAAYREFWGARLDQLDVALLERRLARRESS